MQQRGYFDAEPPPPTPSSSGSRAFQYPPMVPAPAGRYTNQQYQSWPSSSHSAYPPVAGPSTPAYPSVMVTNTHRSAAPRLSIQQFLESLDLLEYYNAFITEGFDRMESLVEIQEDDFIALGIKRGHRRIIQRELATMRGIPVTTPLVIGSKEIQPDDEEPPPVRESAQQSNKNTFYLERPNMPAQASSEPGTKRRYRRHPKPDPNAPEKPPSAYVEFSNSVRDDFKGKSFTEIARLVGEMWQSLDKEEKERLETRAGQEKIRYASLLASYKTTPEYAQYQEYLADFKKKHPQDAASAQPDLPTPSEATSPPLNIRSSGEESMMEGGIPLPSPSDHRKRQRLGSVGLDRGGGRDAVNMRLHESGENRTMTAMSDLRSSSRPSYTGSMTDMSERGNPG